MRIDSNDGRPVQVPENAERRTPIPRMREHFGELSSRIAGAYADTPEVEGLVEIDLAVRQERNAG